jgi:hypothetical protein
MTEYVMHPEDNPVEVVRGLLDKVSDPSQVMWSPRPDVPGGGVYVVNDDNAVAEVSAAMKQRREAEAQRIADAQAAADARDAQADETGLTPTQLGIPANQGSDPGAPGTAGELADLSVANRGDGLLAPELVTNPDGTVTPAEDVDPDADPDAADEEPVADDPATPEDESKMTPAQRRAAKRKAAAAEAAAADEAKSGDASQEETK